MHKACVFISFMPEAEIVVYLENKPLWVTVYFYGSDRMIARQG